MVTYNHAVKKIVPYLTVMLQVNHYNNTVDGCSSHVHRTKLKCSLHATVPTHATVQHAMVEAITMLLPIHIAAQ